MRTATPRPVAARKRRHVAFRAFASLFVILVLAGAAVALYEFAMAGNIYPGVRLGGVDVGGLSRAEALDRLAAARDVTTAGRITLRAGGKEWAVTPGQLGFAVDVPASVQSAYQLGRNGDAISRLHAQGSLLVTGKALPLVGRYDMAKVRAYVATVAAQLDGPPRSAMLALTPTGPQLRAPARDGLRLDRAGAVALLVAAVMKGQPATLDLPVVVTPPAISTASAQRESARLSRLLGATITLTAGRTSWTLTRADIASMLRLGTARSGLETVYTDHADPAAVAAYVARQATTVDRPGRDARVIYAGGVVHVVPGRDGHVIDRNVTTARLIAALSKGTGAAITAPLLNGPTVSNAEAEAVAARLRKDVLRTTVVWLPQRHWALEAPKLAAALTLRRIPRGSGTLLVPRLDPAVIEAHMPGSRALATIPARNAAVVREGARYVVIPAKIGQHPDYQALADEIVDKPSGRAVYHLPLRPTPPALTTAQAEALARAHKVTG